MRLLVVLFVTLYSIVSLAADQVTPSTPAAPKIDQAATPAPVPAPTPAAVPKIETIGQVIWAKGQVSATLPNQQKRTLARKAEIFKEDTIESDKSSTAQISLTDGTLLAITENTKMQLEKYIFDKTNPSNDSYLMDVAKGGLRTITGQIGKNNPAETKTKTPIATLTSLGTDYSVIVKLNKDTLIAVKSGKIQAKNLKGQVINLSQFDQRFAMINAVNQNMAILKSMPADFNTLNTMKFKESEINKSAPRAGGGGGGFCVGK